MTEKRFDIIHGTREGFTMITDSGTQRRRGTILIALSALLLISWLDPYRDEVTKGNRLFHDKKYSAAASRYKKAEKYAPGENEKKKLSFNTGDAEYMQGNMDNALTSFQRAIQSDDKEVQKKAFFNIGNLHMQQGNYDEAVKAYVNALKIDPNYEKAKKNIEYILKHKQNQDRKNRDSNQRKRDGNRKEKNQDKKDKQNQQDQQNEQNQSMDQQRKSNMSRDQIKNLLESLKNKPVRRIKGQSDGKREVEKPW